MSRPTLGERTTSEPGHPTAQAAASARPVYRRVVSERVHEPLRALTLSQISTWLETSRLSDAPVQPGIVRENSAPKSPSGPHAAKASPRHRTATDAVTSPAHGLLAPELATPASVATPLTAPKPLMVRSASMPVRGDAARFRLPIPKPDAAVWFGGEVSDRVHLSLRPLPSVRPLGAARVADVNGRTLVLSKLSDWSTPLSQRLVSQLLTGGLTLKSVLVVRHEGFLRRVNARGAVLPLPDGLYTFCIDQGDRLLLALSPNPKSTAQRSAEGRSEDGAYGCHGDLLVHLPGRFFGEVQIVNQQAVAWNNRSSNYMTPAELAAEVADHDVLRNAAFFPVQGGP